MAKIYLKTVPGPDEKVLILAVREAHFRPFQATDWTDLRVGFFLSICGNADPGEDDTITGLSETIGGDFTDASDRVRIGLTNRTTSTVLLGYTNMSAGRVQHNLGNSQLVSSDVGIGTTNAFFWRPKNGFDNGSAVKIIDSGFIRANGVTGSQPHFVQDTTGAAGYCTLLGLRFTRPDAGGRSNIITMQVKKAVGGYSSDILFNSDPSNAVAEAQLESFPTDVQTLGPVELSHVPDTFFFYWPWHNSRLRIHQVCVLKVA